MEALWITLKTCVPIIVAGTALYLFRNQLPSLWKRALRQKFFPDLKADANIGLTALSVAFGIFVAFVISHSDAFVGFPFYSASLMLGTLALVIVRTPFRCFYTLSFALTAYLGLFFRVAGLNQSWNADTVFVMTVFFLCSVIAPASVAWVVTLFRQDKHP